MEDIRHPDGVTRYAADAHDLASYERAQVELSRLRSPLLHDGSAHNSRLFVAYFDGTGNDASRPDLGRTNVASLHQATLQASLRDSTLGTSYLRGPGTQGNEVVSIADSARGFSYDARLETMYYDFCMQAKVWLREDPHAQISLANVGFSRGSEQAAGFARLVAERGIQDVDHGTVTRDADGLIVQHRYPPAPLVPGKDIAQAELLFDPVGTGKPYDRDRRPPPQVLTGLQITAEDERRDPFKSSRILDPGFTHDGRFLNVIVGGCHSDIGGSYREDGLARRNYNLGVDFLNSLSDRPFLAKQALRPDLDVVHRSVEHAPIYDDDVYRANERRGVPLDARRGAVESIGGDVRDHSASARDAEPIDRSLDERFQRRAIDIAPTPTTPAEYRNLPPASQRHDLQPETPRKGLLQSVIGVVAEAETTGDRMRRSDALDAYLASPDGQAFAARVDARVQALQQAAIEPAAPEAPSHAPRARSLSV